VYPGGVDLVRVAPAVLSVFAAACTIVDTPVGGGTDPGDAAAPADAGLTPDMQAWLGPMNQARADVGVAPLGWDPIAAQVAATYAATCNFAHNPNAGAEYMQMGGTTGLGEDISAGAPTQDPGAAVASWLSEKASYDHAGNTCAAGQVCGHYTQIVWSATTAVGCAHASCTTGSPFNGFTNWDFIVCDFSPPGNVGGQAPY
jgi:pathogenesis-related protein 1